MTTTHTLNPMHVRRVSIDGQPWFSIKDILRAAGYGNPSAVWAMVARIDGNDLGHALMPDPQGRQRRRPVINLAGAAELLTRSRMPLAPVVLAWLRAVAAMPVATVSR